MGNVVNMAPEKFCAAIGGVPFVDLMVTPPSLLPIPTPIPTPFPYSPSLLPIPTPYPYSLSLLPVPGRRAFVADLPPIPTTIALYIIIAKHIVVSRSRLPNHDLPVIGLEP